MTADGRRPGWENVDADADQARDYLDTVTRLDAIQASSRRDYELLHAEPGSQILDAGCGTGDDALLFGDLVGPEGDVVGIDKSQSLIEEANARADGTTTVEFQTGDIMNLSFADGTFDASRANRVLQHLPDPRGAVAELCRVTRPGGRIAVADPDWETCIVAAPDADPEVTAAVTAGEWADTLNPHIGRQLYALARDEGLTEIEIDPTTVVFTDFELASEVLYFDGRLEAMQDADVLSRDQADDWLEAVRRAGADDRLFCSITGYTVAGTVPPPDDT
ncbi:methyltransferase domain-containing protein [Natronococcus jeotgali]|uniref:Methyltransferase domain-containing protein n=1 Tax=Natronococcus jeotgali DSM 18795 TaxID=1227498 RepID=L9XR14_9EURY|nr:methyltransferase domain-containing protein [Natronococcus jeotgali]ELY63023.1 hypothetical protein C492_07405 [Natronococcus jeotgali DSM 18795]